MSWTERLVLLLCLALLIGCALWVDWQRLKPADRIALPAAPPSGCWDWTRTSMRFGDKIVWEGRDCLNGEVAFKALPEGRTP